MSEDFVQRVCAAFQAQVGGSQQMEVVLRSNACKVLINVRKKFQLHIPISFSINVL